CNLHRLTIKNSFIIAGILSRDERSRCEIASSVQRRREEVRNGVDGDQNPDPLGWQAESEEEWREDDERAGRDARDSKGEEDRGEGDRGQAAEVQRGAVEPSDEERADGPRYRRGDFERGDSEREDEAGHFLRQGERLLGALDERGERGDGRAGAKGDELRLAGG